MFEFSNQNCIGFLNVQGNGEPPHIYNWILHCLQNGSKVIYSVEPAPFEVIRKLLEMDKHVLTYMENKSLQVIEPETIYSVSNSDTRPEADVIYDKWLSLANEVAEGSKNSSILIVSTPKLLGSESGLENLLSITGWLEKKCSDHVEIICSYGLGYFFGLSLGEAISLMLMNQRNMRRCDNPGLVISKSRIIDVVCKGLDRSLGNGSGRLIMTTLKYLYHLDSSDLLADPYLLEIRLRKLIGNMSNYAFGYVLAEIKNELILNQQYLRRTLGASMLSN